MKSRIVFTFFLLLFSVFLQAQENDSMYMEQDFLILLSTKSYTSALTTAKQASASMNIDLKLRELAENKESGLSFSKEVCEEEGIEYPAYYARGRWDDGVYISIEYSNAYSGFAEGYYIVIAASGSKKDDKIQSAYQKLRSKYTDTYFKRSKVYLGCMH